MKRLTHNLLAVIFSSIFIIVLINNGFLINFFGMYIFIPLVVSLVGNFIIKGGFYVKLISILGCHMLWGLYFLPPAWSSSDGEASGIMFHLVFRMTLISVFVYVAVYLFFKFISREGSKRER